jgi:hypothetical protein
VANRLTQIAVETLASGNPNARLTRGAVETLALVAPPSLTAQTITFPAISDHPDTDAPFTLAAHV